MFSFIMIFGMFNTVFTGCKEGPIGPTGLAGSNGTNGTNGVNGSTRCESCHNVSTSLKSKIMQYQASTHSTGGNFERNTTDCAPCHTHEGFLETLSTGADSTVASISNPTPQNCRTCHNIHTEYDTTDFDLRTTDPVTLRINGATVDLGKGNLCIRCHQPRTPDPLPVVGGGSVDITSSYWGPHYGAQAVIFGGTGGYEVVGSETYQNSYHATLTSGCGTCHMPDPYGTQAGGHTLKLSYSYHGSMRDYTPACTNCHSTLTDFDRNSVQTEISGLLDSLKTKLLAVNVIDSTDHAVDTIQTSIHAGALMNYLLVLKDGSKGIHNTKYSRALLINAIESF